MRKQVELLKDHAHFLADLFHVADIIAKLDTVHDDLSLLVFLQTVEAANECRFP